MKDIEGSGPRNLGDCTTFGAHYGVYYGQDGRLNLCAVSRWGVSEHRDHVQTMQEQRSRSALGYSRQFDHVHTTGKRAESKESRSVRRANRCRACRNARIAASEAPGCPVRRFCRSYQRMEGAYRQWLTGKQRHAALVRLPACSRAKACLPLSTPASRPKSLITTDFPILSQDARGRVKGCAPTRRNCGYLGHRLHEFSSQVAESQG